MVEDSTAIPEQRILGKSKMNGRHRHKDVKVSFQVVCACLRHMSARRSSAKRSHQGLSPILAKSVNHGSVKQCTRATSLAR